MKTLVALALALAAVVLSVLSFPRYAYACTCAPPLSDTKGHFQAADAVFVGAAVAVERVGNLPKKATVSVIAVYKGEVDRTTLVETPGTDDDCGIDFGGHGERYAFFATREDDRWTATSCGTGQDAGALTAAGYEPVRVYGDESASVSSFPRAASPVPPPDPSGRGGPIAAAGVMMATVGATLLVVLRARAHRQAD